MDLAREVLDQQVVDRHGVHMGKVDGVILEVRDGLPPRVVAIEVGMVTFARRLSARLASWLDRWLSTHGPCTPATFRVPWSKVLAIGVDVRVDLDAAETPAVAWERWIRDRILARIPGA